MTYFGSQPTGDRGDSNPDNTLSAALSDFRQARREAGIRAVLARLHGTSLALLSYEDVVKRLQITGQIDLGVREIPLDKIVGSVGRADEFDRMFLPLKNYDAQRWAGVRMAAGDPSELPAIDVYQIGDAYFVIDGNHRVSIARHSGLEYLEANVIEIKTRVPLPKDLAHDALIVASEEAAFLEQTHLDLLRDDAEISTMICGQYDKVADHIALHRYYLEQNEGRKLTDNEAVQRWYDEAYLPVVETIREHGLLRGFPERTELDMYLWVAENQDALRSELGWELDSQTIVENLEAPPSTEQAGIADRLVRRVLQAVMPGKRQDVETWSQRKLMDRYSDRLFATVLTISDGQQTHTAITQAARVAALEAGQVLAIEITASEKEAVSERERSEMRRWFHAMLEASGVSGEIGFERGNPADIIQRRTYLVDLLIMDLRLFDCSKKEESALAAVLAKSPRPVLLVAGDDRPVKRLLLLFDGRPQAQEALFVAAYLAEMWGCEVTMLAQTRAAPLALSKAAPYLELHDAPPVTIIAGDFKPNLVFQTAAEIECDLVIIGGYNQHPLQKTEVALWLCNAPPDLRRPLLICP